MMQTIQAKDTDLRYLINNFGIQLVLDDSFFHEWQEDLPQIDDLDKQLLDKVKMGYLNLLNYPPLLEDIVRMAVANPLLFIGDFYLAPFYVKSEESIDIAVPDEDVIINLPGSNTQAQTLDELVERIREAIELCLEFEEEKQDSLDFVGIQRVAVEI
ncbi:type II toxin-antitoxin system HicB family antitoxin [Nostoc edaphicum]|uniref:type II toxin-antitoxin system HicB family antitoxin n=1 Tax=Nostoc edaphicum TaxID=264686 RepID=UPI001D14C3EA|nr:type II toxin-antitoxin system HicB family antitoxin [Nostoc edaphicum]